MSGDTLRGRLRIPYVRAWRSDVDRNFSEIEDRARGARSLIQELSVRAGSTSFSIALPAGVDTVTLRSQLILVATGAGSSYLDTGFNGWRWVNMAGGAGTDPGDLELSNMGSASVDRLNVHWTFSGLSGGTRATILGQVSMAGSYAFGFAGSSSSAAPPATRRIRFYCTGAASFGAGTHTYVYAY